MLRYSMVATTPDRQLSEDREVAKGRESGIRGFRGLREAWFMASKVF